MRLVGGRVALRAALFTAAGVGEIAAAFWNKSVKWAGDARQPSFYNGYFYGTQVDARNPQIARSPWQSRAALLRPGGTKPDGPFAVWRIDLCAVPPAQQARSAPAPQRAQSTGQGRSPWQSRAALLRPGGTKPDGPFAVWRIDLCAVPPAQQARSAPAPQRAQSTGQGRSPWQSRAALLRPGGTKPDGLLPSGVLSYVRPPRIEQAQSAPAAPTGAAVRGAGAQPLPSCRRERGGLGIGSCRRPWGRLHRGLRWCSCKGCSSPRPRF